MELIAKKLAEFASEAMLFEVSSYPSPGLVSPVSNGSHKDMNYYTFLGSISVLNKYMYEFALAGIQKDKIEDIFDDIRKVGLKAEIDMFEITKGVNTHKGMIFLMGITLSALAYGISMNYSFDKIQDIIKIMCRDLTSELKNIDFKSLKEKSHGEKLYLEYGFLGIRGEAEDGVPLAFNIGLNCYENCSDLSENDRLLQTLLKIMSECEDSTILHRKDLETLNYVKTKSKELLNMGGMYNSEMTKKLYELNEVFIEKNISPGGSADILAITVLLALAKETFFAN
ncbi:MAG: triphosphoribosyl-dephospho-CoA synthase CitG [Sarcina sp.]